MNLKIIPRLFLLLLLAGGLRAETVTNFVVTTNYVVVTNDSLIGAVLQIQEQLHAARLAIESTRANAETAAQKNADALSARMQMLEQAVQNQHAEQTDAARKTQQLTLMLAGVFGLIGLGVMLLVIYFQWRAFRQIAEMGRQQNLLMSHANAARELTAPARATVEISNARLANVVGQLEHKIRALENVAGATTTAMPTAMAEPNGTVMSDPLAEGQKLLDAGEPQRALEVFEKILRVEPEHSGALLKKAAALEKLSRLDEALDFCDRAIQRDPAQTVGFLQKGGLLNKLNRHAEALDCFERALHPQDKNGRAN
jgi:tetratricopeptide (TPR) repeat protein